MRGPREPSYTLVGGLSVFRRAVYRLVARIPKGRVLSYAEVARRVGVPRAARAVGTALAANRFLDVPCHRVIRSDGHLGEYAFGGSKAKERRLRREGVCIRAGRVIFPE